VSMAVGPIVVPLASVFSLDLRFAPDTVQSITDDASEAAGGLTLISLVIPLVLVVLAIGLVLLPVFLARRRRRSAPRPQETVTEPTTAPPAATVGAADEG
jgi:hypothetical protein